MKKSLLLVVILLFSSQSLVARQCVLPASVELEKAEDYAPHQQTVLACIDFLEQRPLEENDTARKLVSAFLVKWMSGAPDIHITINEELAPSMDKNPDMLMTYMGGWARHEITQKDASQYEHAMAALSSMFKVYTSKKKGVKKDKGIEKLLKMQKKGELEEFVRKTLLN